MRTVSRFAVLSAVAAFGLVSVVIAPALAAPPTGVQSVTLTEGGNWVIPADATNIKVTIAAAGAEPPIAFSGPGGRPGYGGIGYYLLDDDVAGETLTYTAGVRGGGTNHPYLSNRRGGQGAAIAVAGDLLAVVGGGGGSGHGSWNPLDYYPNSNGGDGGVAVSAGVAIGGDGTQALAGERGMGQGGQITGGGKASTTASDAGTANYGGVDGGDTSTATALAITLAAGGHGGHVCGSGGGGYTGGAGGTADAFFIESQLASTYGSGGGGSGFLANDARIAWDGSKSAATNAGNGYITITYTMPPALTASAATVEATFGVAYAGFPITAAGATGPYTLELTEGTLPAGLSFDADTGGVSGTPTVTGEFSVTVTVTDSALGEKHTKAVTIAFDIAGDPVVSAPVSATAGDTITISGTGFEPGSYTIELHSEPVTLATVTVDESASFSTSVTIPVATPGGTHSIVVASGDAIYSTSEIDVTAALTVSATTVDATFGVEYSGSPITAAGGTSPYTYEVTDGTLPTGLSLDADTGEISGTPTVIGESSVTITVTDSAPGERRIKPVTVAFDIAADPAITAPLNAKAGDTITITGTGFAPGTYTIELHSDPVTLATITVDATASFSTSVTIPVATPGGTHSIVVASGEAIYSTSEITVAGGDEEGDNAGDLSDTGPIEDAILLAMIASAILAAGIGVRALGIRRR